MYYASYCSAYFKGLLDMMYIYKTKMVLSACSRLYFIVEVSMNACEDQTPSAKCGGWLPRARGKKERGRQRGDAGLQEGYCMCERKTKHLRISDGVGFTKALTSRTGDHIQFCNSPYSLPNFKRGVFHTYPSMFLSWWYTAGLQPGSPSLNILLPIYSPSFLSTCPSQSGLCGFIMSENINSPPKNSPVFFFLFCSSMTELLLK